MPGPGAGFISSQGAKPQTTNTPTTNTATNDKKLWLKGFDKPCMGSIMKKVAMRVIDDIKSNNPDKF
eukprot:1982787-Heterocapsa_arctica.AAC.1